MNSITHQSPALSLAIPNIQSRSIMACFTQGLGFQNRFKVCLRQQHNAVTPFDSATLGLPGGNLRGTLTIADDDVANYTIPNIDLDAIRLRITRRQRERIIELTLRTEVTDVPRSYTPPVFEAVTQAPLVNCDLRDDYQMSLGGPMENLLAFEAYLPAIGAPILRLIRSKADPANCLLNKMMAVHNDWYATRTFFQPFELTVSPLRNPLLITFDNLLTFTVREVFGDLGTLRLPSLEGYIGSGSALPDHDESPLVEWSIEDALNHDKDRRPTIMTSPRTIQVCDFVFAPGTLRVSDFR